MHKTILLMFLIAVLSASEKPVAKWYTSMGEFCCELRGDLVPIPANNFIDLATGNKTYTDENVTEQTIDYPFYDNLLFHRVE